MHILVTNDDGIYSPGIAAIAKELAGMAKVSLLAPDRNWSASSHARTLDRPLHIRPAHWMEGINAWMTDGSPADCVAAAIGGFFSSPIDLIVSGINTSANLAQDVIYSATVAAAMEAVLNGIPGIALSLDTADQLVIDEAFDWAAAIARQVIQPFLKRLNLLRSTVLNINIPLLPEESIRGVEITRLGTRIYNETLEKRVDPRGRIYYWTVGDPPGGVLDMGSDIAAVANGYVSITPLKPNFMDQAMINPLKSILTESAKNTNPILIQADCFGGD